MNVLNISIDKCILDSSSEVARRMAEYGRLVDSFVVIVPSKNDQEIHLSDKVSVIGVGGLNKLMRLLRMYFVLKKKLDKDNYDVITVQDPFETALVAWLASRKKGIGLNVQLHGDFFGNKQWRHYNLWNFYRYYLGRFMIGRADSFRVVSKRIKENLMDSFCVPEERIITVPIFVNHEKSRNIVAREDNDNFVYLWIGRFVTEKNLPLLLSAFEAVLEDKPKSILRLIGKGLEKENIVQMARYMRLDQSIEFYDWVDDVDSEYQKADAYVLSSDNEGWGMVVIEAMRNNLPVVMTDVGCANEVVRNKENGIVVPVGDKWALAGGMIRIQSQDLREKFRSRFQETLSRLPSREETLGLYRESWEKAKVRSKKLEVRSKKYEVRSDFDS